MYVRFEWDPDKAAANVRKHGVSFEAASFVFFDPFAITEQDRIEDGEHRWRTLGAAHGLTLLVVAHTIAEKGEVEVIRIISARRADRTERKRYEEERR